MVHKILIENFKCFQSQTISLGNLTLFAGENGIGKSTTIQAILLARSFIEKTSGKETKDEPIAINGPYLLQLGEPRHLKNNLADTNENISFYFYTDRNYVAIINLNNNNDKVLASSVLPSSFIDDVFLHYMPFYYLNAERLGPRIRQELIKTHPVHSYLLNVGYQGEFTGEVLEQLQLQSVVLKKDDYRIFNKVIEEDLRTTLVTKQIETWMNYIIPGFAFRQKVDTAMQVAQVEIQNNHTDLDFLPSNSTGFGLTYVLPIVITGIIANKGCMMIVENPEAHLSPAAQVRIGEFLAVVAEYGVQVIIETHSDHILNGIRVATKKGLVSPENVVFNFFERDAKTGVSEVTEISIDKNGKLDYWPKGFFDEWENQLRKLINFENL